MQPALSWPADEKQMQSAPLAIIKRLVATHARHSHIVGKVVSTLFGERHAVDIRQHQKITNHITKHANLPGDTRQRCQSASLPYS